MFGIGGAVARKLVAMHPAIFCFARSFNLSLIKPPKLCASAETADAGRDGIGGRGTEARRRRVGELRLQARRPAIVHRGLHQRDEVGDFPRRLELEDGNMEAAEWQSGRYLRVSTNGKFAIKLPDVLPDRFTLECDMSAGWNYQWTVVSFDEKAPHDVRFRSFFDRKGNAGVYGGNHNARSLELTRQRRRTFEQRRLARWL
jgi:hypothetical protein